MKEKGFTLIELLAVIVILAIIAIITVPMVLGSIDKAKLGAFRTSAQNTLDAAELYEATYDEITSEGMNIQALDMKQKENYQGMIFVTEEQDYVLKNFTDGTYCANGTKTALEVTKGSCENTSKEPMITKVEVIKKTTKSIQVRVNAEDSVAITRYGYCIESCEEEANWQYGTEPDYTFDHLTHGTTYTIHVRVKNLIGFESEKEITERTETLPSPTYQISPSGWSKSKTVTVTYPEGYQNYYQVTEGTVKENGTAVTVGEEKVVSGTTATLTFESNGRMIAKTTDGYNEITVSDLVISQVDTEAPVVSSLAITSTNTNYNAVTTTITSSVSDNSGSLQMYISNSGYETGGKWESYNANKSWNVGGTLDGGTRTVYITYQDPAGNKINKSISYGVYRDCSNLTTQWSGTWSTCSKTCGGGTQTMSGTKKDTKTGSSCGSDSKSQACNTQSCNYTVVNGASGVTWFTLAKTNTGNTNLWALQGDHYHFELFNPQYDSGNHSINIALNVFTTNPIDLTNYKTVAFNGNCTYPNCPVFYISPVKPTSAIDLPSGSITLIRATDFKTQDIDISSYTGNYYFGIYAMCPSCVRYYADIYSIILLP